MIEDSLTGITVNIKDIPALPSVVMQVNSVLMKKSETVQKVSEIIEKDFALTSKILRLANSSYYGLSYHVDTLSKAVSVLGFNAVRNLAVTVSLLKMCDNGKVPSLDTKGLWLHNLGCAIVSKALTGKKKDNALHEKAFICGMLHDIGKIILYINFPDKMKELMEKIRENKSMTLIQAEKAVLKTTHADVGAYVAEQWHFPQELTNTIAFHHNPDKTMKSPELVYAVHAGNEIAKALGLGKSTSEKAVQISPVAWEKLGLSEKGLSDLIPSIKEHFNEIVNFMEI